MDANAVKNFHILVMFGNHTRSFFFYILFSSETPVQPASSHALAAAALSKDPKVSQPEVKKIYFLNYAYKTYYVV